MQMLEKDLQFILKVHQAERKDHLPEEVVAKYLVNCLDNLNILHPFTEGLKQYESLDQPLDM